MTNQEFSDSLSTLLNSYDTQSVFGEQASHREIVLDEYEKSVLLTQAQDVIVKSYFDGTLNSENKGFDDSTKRQIDFSSLINVVQLNKSTGNYERFDDRGIIFELPKNTLFILNESLKTDNVNYVIVPINYKEYDRLMSKPYAQPLKKQAWRLIQNNTSDFDIMSELIPRWDIKDSDVVSYKLRYVRRPAPIILVDLPNGLEIDGISKETSCELNPILHHEILNKAVEIAMATRGGRATNNPQ